MRFTDDRIPEDEYIFDPFAETERKPETHEVELPRCRNCPDRYVISDGKGEWVHEDDYAYSCETDPRARKYSTLFATPVLS